MILLALTCLRHVIRSDHESVTLIGCLVGANDICFVDLVAAITDHDNVAVVGALGITVRLHLLKCLTNRCIRRNGVEFIHSKRQLGNKFCHVDIRRVVMERQAECDDTIATKLIHRMTGVDFGGKRCRQLIRFDIESIACIAIRILTDSSLVAIWCFALSYSHMIAVVGTTIGFDILIEVSTYSCCSRNCVISIHCIRQVGIQNSHLNVRSVCFQHRQRQIGGAVTILSGSVNMTELKAGSRFGQLVCCQRETIANIVRHILAYIFRIAYRSSATGYKNLIAVVGAACLACFLHNKERRTDNCVSRNGIVLIHSIGQVGIQNSNRHNGGIVRSNRQRESNHTIATQPVRLVAVIDSTRTWYRELSRRNNKSLCIVFLRRFADRSLERCSVVERHVEREFDDTIAAQLIRLRAVIDSALALSRQFIGRNNKAIAIVFLLFLADSSLERSGIVLEHCKGQRHCAVAKGSVVFAIALVLLAGTLKRQLIRCDSESVGSVSLSRFADCVAVVNLFQAP